MGKENHLSFKAIWARFHAPTPAFWKAVRLKAAYYGGALVACAAGIGAINEMPQWVYDTCTDIEKFVPAAILLIGLMASLTTNPENPPTDKL